jgi:elongation factor P
MLSYTELKPGRVIVVDGQPYEILEYSFSKMQRQKGVVQSKMKNLINGKILSKSIHSNENFEEAEVEKVDVKYLYNHRGEYWFSELEDPSKRFSLTEEVVGNTGYFLKNNSKVEAVMFKNQVINIKPPIKVDLKVKSAPPSDKGDTATGGKKPVILETDAKINVPLFINTGDVIRINTDSGEYVERVEKAN